MKTNTIAMLVGSLGLFLFLDSAAATGQCPGQIYGVAAEVDNSLTIAVSGAESNCGCLGNRLILPAVRPSGVKPRPQSGLWCSPG